MSRDERAQRAQVASVADAADHDERGAVAEVGAEARQLDPAREQLALLAHVLDRVDGEALERLVDLAAALPPSRARTRSASSTSPAREQRAPRAALARAHRPSRPGRAPRSRARRRRRLRRTARRRAGPRAGCRPRRAAGARGSGRCPPEEGLQFSTATAPAAISSSAETRSMSRWSISAMSPAHEVADEQLRAAAGAHRTGRPARGAGSARRASAAGGLRLPRAGSRCCHRCESNARAWRLRAPKARAGRAAADQAARRSSRAWRRALASLAVGAEHAHELAHDLALARAARPSCASGRPRCP